MQGVNVIVDKREKNIDIIEGLAGNNVNVMFAQLPVGDYIVSDRICIERKTVSDFESSIMDYRLFEQSERLSESFTKPVIIIEGDYMSFNLDKNVILGTILKLYTKYNIQVLFSYDPHETSYIISKFAEKEQVEDKREARIIGRKKAYTMYQWQLLILSSIPGIGTKLAKELLKHFKTIKNVATAEIEEIKKVDKIGEKKAERLYNVLNLESQDGIVDEYAKDIRTSGTM